MAKIADEPVGHIDGGARKAAQSESQSHARLGRMPPLCCLRKFRMHEPQGSAAELAGNPHVVSGPCACPRERLPARNFAERRDRDGDEPTPRGVAADEIDPVALREREQAFAKGAEPALVGGLDGEGERDPARCRAARGKVGQVNGQYFVPEGARFGVREEMAAFDEHIARHRELHPVADKHAGTVIAYALYRIFRRPVEEAPDELELVQAIFRARATSSGRTAPAIFSSTPFTKR